MNVADRTRLTAALRDHVAKVADDLRVQMRDDAAVRERAKRLHVDEQVGEDFDVWTDLLARRAAVLWVLKSVYVRVLEDRGLLRPNRFLDVEAQQLFERLAPNLGETAFLRWVYSDLASENGGLPELFAAQPAELAVPSDQLSRELLDFWRHKDPDSGERWSFSDERFDDELMGDLYQDLDPVVKDKFALCQTPHFLRDFILQQSLAPALREFGAENVRLLDPACGSGHFLIDGLKALVAATEIARPEWGRKALVVDCLGRVVGLDLNDYACALARARLIMVAAELAHMTTLSEATELHAHVYWADGLEQVEKGKDKRGEQLLLLEPSDKVAPRASLTMPVVRATVRAILREKFHAVVANPPYHGEPDPLCRDYHREKLGRRPRYWSASGRYTLATVFFERCLQLCVDGGYCGVILANSFLNKSFGKVFIEKVLSQTDLNLVADTSGAILAASGFETPTIMLFATNRPPTSDTVRVVAGKAGDTSRSRDASTGDVWTGIAEHWDDLGYQNSFVSVQDMRRTDLAHWPWILSTGLADQIRESIESNASKRLSDDVQIGVACVTGEDACFILTDEVARRLGIEETKEIATGERIRDWSTTKGDVCIFPYDERYHPLPLADIPNTQRHLWKYRVLLRERRQFGTPILEKGMRWYELQELYTGKLGLEQALVFPYLGTHNHFALEQEGRLFKNTAFVGKITGSSDPMLLLGLLNSSTLAFWIRQRLAKAGGRSSGTKRQSEPWAQRLVFSARLMKAAPISSVASATIANWARQLHEAGARVRATSPFVILDGNWKPAQLDSILNRAQEERSELRRRMVSLQEELDWAVYRSYGLLDSPEQEDSPDAIEPIESSARPFAIQLARSAAAGDSSHYWFDAMEVQALCEVPTDYTAETRSRIEQRLKHIQNSEKLQILEAPEFKRKWEPDTFSKELQVCARAWLASRMEAVVRDRGAPMALPHIASALQDDASFLAVATIFQGRRDIDVPGLVGDILEAESVPNHPYHTYSETGLAKRAAWEAVWEAQRLEDADGETTQIPQPPEFSQGSRGKSKDFLRTEFWKLRGKLDVPNERFVAFTEVPGRVAPEILHGWAGWTSLQRARALLQVDEELDDAGTSLADRTGVLESAWALLHELPAEERGPASRLKAELQSIVGIDGLSKEKLADWRKRFPPPTKAKKRKSGGKKKK